MKLLSVAIPCYNSEAYMSKCINSLLIGGEEVEIIIVDDGSSDRTAEIADDYAEKYPTIVKAIHQENGGHGQAVNTGIKNATGLYFKVVDSIIFDVDGTLWDSTGIVAEAWSDYLIHTEHMDTDVSAKRLMGLFGQLLPDIAKALFPELPEAEQLRIIDGCCQAEHEALLRKCAPLYPDLEKTLKILSSRFPLFIVSNCQAGYIEVFLKSTGFGHYFKGHLCPGDTGMAKAENIMKIREDNNLSDPVYIGDTIGDFNACQKAGVPFIFAEYGFGQVDKPDYRITRPFDLTEICR